MSSIGSTVGFPIPCFPKAIRGNLTVHGDLHVDGNEYIEGETILTDRIITVNVSGGTINPALPYGIEVDPNNGDPKPQLAYTGNNWSAGLEGSLKPIATHLQPWDASQVPFISATDDCLVGDDKLTFNGVTGILTVSGGINVQGPINANDVNINDALYIDNASTNSFKIENDASSNLNISYSTDDITYTDRLTILADGKVGINKSLPVEQFDVVGNSLFKGLVTVHDSSNAEVAQLSNTVGTPSKITGSTNIATAVNTVVGIGTVSPDSKVHIKDTADTILTVEKDGKSKITVKAGETSAQIGTVNNFPVAIVRNDVNRITVSDDVTTQILGISASLVNLQLAPVAADIGIYGTDIKHVRDGVENGTHIYNLDANDGKIYLENRDGGYARQTRLFIDSDGEVGIGNITPAVKLHVSGNIRGDQVQIDDANHYVDVTANEISFTDPVNGTKKISDITTKWSDTGVSDDIYRMSRIGIECPAPDLSYPSSDLTIGNGTGSHGLTIRSGGGFGGEITFAQGTTPTTWRDGWIGYDHTADMLQFGVNDQSAVIINSTGQVGINTVAPKGKLDIVTAACAATPDTSSDELVLQNVSDNCGMTIMTSISGSDVITFKADNGDYTSLQYNHATDSFGLTGSVGGSFTLDSTRFSTGQYIRGARIEVSDANTYLTKNVSNELELVDTVNGTKNIYGIFDKSGSNIYFSDGQVSIGTSTAPTSTYKLRVGGSEEITSSLYMDTHGEKIYFKDSSGNIGVNYCWVGWNGDRFMFGSYTSHLPTLINGSYNMIYPNAVIGQYDRSPDAALHVIGPANQTTGHSVTATGCKAILEQKDTADNYLMFRGDTASTKKQGLIFTDNIFGVGKLEYNHATNEMQATVNNELRLKINSSYGTEFIGGVPTASYISVQTISGSTSTNNFAILHNYQDSVNGNKTILTNSNNDTGTIEIQTKSSNVIHTGIQLLNNGSVKLGDIAGGNTTNIDNDGSITFSGTATVWDDVNLGFGALGSGGSAPDPIDYNALGIIMYGFNGGSTLEQVFGCIEIPHWYKEGSNFVPHIHWCPSTTGGGNVKWQLKYTIVNAGVVGTSTTISATGAAGTTAWEGRRTDLPTISGSGRVIGEQIMFVLFRNPTDGDDTYGDDAGLFTFGFHFEKDSCGSRTITTK